MIEYHNLLGGCDTQSHLDFDPGAFERRSSSHQSISHEPACTIFSFLVGFTCAKVLDVGIKRSVCLHELGAGDDIEVLPTNFSVESLEDGA